MNMTDVYSLIDRFETSSLSEIDLEMEDMKLSLKRNCVQAAPAVTQGMPAVSTDLSVTTKQPAANEATESKDAIHINAPFVGTFYRSASPEEKPFVMIGQKVQKGQVVGIIEAMKLMNEITAPQDGVVEAILAEDGEMVEYDKTIIVLGKI